jgi:sugar fermentation stimulation protein A
LNFFGPTEKAVFIRRPNRFVVVCKLHGKTLRAFLPNPGRLWELLLPGAVLHLEKSPRPGRKLPFTVVAIEREGRPVMAHTLRTNDFVEHLLRKGMVPGLEGTKIVKREVQHGNSRFDFLLKRGKERSTWKSNPAPFLANELPCSPMQSLPGGRSTWKNWRS